MSLILQQVSQQTNVITSTPCLLQLAAIGVQQSLINFCFQVPQQRQYGTQQKLASRVTTANRQQKQKSSAVGVGQIFGRNVSTISNFNHDSPLHHDYNIMLERPSEISSKEVSSFVNQHFNPCYACHTSSLAGPTEGTIYLNNICNDLQIQEMKSIRKHIDENVFSGMTAFQPGYIAQQQEQIVGLQTDEPLKQAVKPNCGIHQMLQMVEENANVSKMIYDSKSRYSGVYNVFSKDMVEANKCALISGLCDGYGRSRIGGDYQRVALYGVDHIINAKKMQLERQLRHPMTLEKIQSREDVKEQIKALNQLKSMALQYGYDIGQPAQDAHQAVQWIYFAFLGSIQEHDGASMCLGKVDTFLDAYIQQDLNVGRLTEETAQQLIDQLVLKLRMVRQLRPPEYSALFTDENKFATVQIGGWNQQLNCPDVTKTSYRFVNALYNLGPAQSTNIQVIWDNCLPADFKQMCCDASLLVNGLEYLSTESPRIASQNSNLKIQSCRINLYKFLMLVLNQGRDNITQTQIAPKWPKINLSQNIEFEHILKRVDAGMEWLTNLCVDMSNISNYMQDKYDYERLDMALQDTNALTNINFEISGFEEFISALSALKFGKVTPVFNFSGDLIDIETEGDFPAFASKNAHVKQLKNWVEDTLLYYLQKQPQYKNCVPTLSKRLRQHFIDPSKLELHACSAQEVGTQNVEQLLKVRAQNLESQLDAEFEKDTGRVNVEYLSDVSY